MRLEATDCHCYLRIHFEYAEFFNCLFEYCLLKMSYKQGLCNSMNSQMNSWGQISCRDHANNDNLSKKECKLTKQTWLYSLTKTKRCKPHLDPYLYPYTSRVANFSVNLQAKNQATTDLLEAWFPAKPSVRNRHTHAPVCRKVCLPRRKSSGSS
jgi:hypothetical protein